MNSNYRKNPTLNDLKEMGLTREQYIETIQSLITKGLVVLVEDNGEQYYGLTPMGQMIANQMNKPKEWVN